MEGVHLYDIVTLYHSKLGISATAQVTRIEYDVLLDRMNAISLGTLNIALGAEKLTSSQVPNETKSGIIQAASLPNAGFKTSILLDADNWTNKLQTVSVTGLEADMDIVVTPDASATRAYSNAGIYCLSQNAGSLTFACETVPSGDLAVNITILGGLSTW